MKHRASTPRLVAVALALALLGIGPPAHAQPRVTDDAGAEIALPRPAQRIVSLAPHLTELLFAAGAGARVVGAVEYSDFPAAARQVERIGNHAQFDLERIAALEPDLIVTWHSGNPSPQVQRLRALGVPIYRSESRELADIASTLRRLGRLAGSPAVADERADRFEREIARLRERYAGRRELRVFHQIWSRPLMTVNGRHLISQALRLCGARNVFADLPALTPQVGEEDVLQADPDVIVSGAPAGSPDGLDRWRRLRSLRAAREGHLLTVDPDTLHRATDRIADGARDLCEKLDAVRASPAR